ncbi:hypothetical protein FH972_022546 [Carpinus fangiana]|uniref:ML-like domain-containing protein n=1 Tax=Carpinus fangiana TaxID=176857 RepID=A0A5N6KSW1_9ROSI|nr:hypothetical protein FH972_022546 [Carpinus fangiana]
MRFSTGSGPSATLIAASCLLAPLTSAEQLIESKSLQSCASDSSNSSAGFSASLFNVVFTPANRSLYVDIVGFSGITGNVTAEIDVFAYGYPAISKKLNGCDVGLQGLCPMTSGQIPIKTNINDISPSVIDSIPGIAYSIPDLDGQVKVKILRTGTGEELACVQAELSNGKTVYQKGVGWATAIIAGLALLVSAVVSGLGHSNTAVHIAANALSLFGFFQHQALFGMTAVPLPPIVSSWTQNFQWSMGIIRVGFIQDIATWYQRSTGGSPSNLLGRLATTSVNVQKRSLAFASEYSSRAARYMSERAPAFMSSAVQHGAKLIRRSNNDNQNAETLQIMTIRGIQRVGFRAGIEITNIFMTGYIFFVVFVMFVVLCVVAFKWILEALARSGKIKGDKFQDFRNGWTTVLKGILFRLVLIGFPQMIILCFWELVVKDSAGEVALAVITVFTFIIMLGWACSKVVRLARRSIAMHKNPAYILYSDPVSLHKWGFLYVQFKATAYWFIIPWLVFLLAVGMFVAFGQHDTGVAQAVGILILEAGLLVAVSVIRPWMDKKTNALNIAIAAVNFVSSIFLLFFTNVFGLPGLVVGVMGVIFFIMNAAFALIMLIMVLVAMGYAVFSKNPDVRYQPMRDDRGSFIKSQTNLTTELDALGATARGESKVPYKPREIDEDSISSTSYEGNQQNAGYSAMGGAYSKEAGLHGTHQNTAYDGGHERMQSMRSEISSHRTQHNASPWQRGAGYD